MRDLADRFRLTDRRATVRLIAVPSRSFIPPFSVIIGRIKCQRNGMCHGGGTGELIRLMEVTLEGRYTGRYAGAVSHQARSCRRVLPGASG